MLRWLCSVMVVASVSLLAIGSTAVLANNACNNGLTCVGHKGNSQTSPTCTSGDSGCTVTPTNHGGQTPPGQPCTSPDSLCSK
jgi:hypothetical protein